MISVEKVKDTDTGGKQTMLNIPVLFNFNSGLGFRCGGVDPIARQTTKKNNDLPF